MGGVLGGEPGSVDARTEGGSEATAPFSARLDAAPGRERAGGAAHGVREAVLTEGERGGGDALELPRARAQVQLERPGPRGGPRARHLERFRSAAHLDALS